MYKPALTAGALLAALSVILGAFGAHALKQILTPDMLQVFETGVRYQFYHSFALLITGIIYGSFKHKFIRMAATFFILGIVLFSGSLYALTLLNIPVLGAITPFGGLFFIAGWLLLFTGILKNK
ncbi:MAG: DUF423 domain-containing protein [Bacteroidota bacterium]